jgi:5-dehydro-2-deoxygluconokinase
MSHLDIDPSRPLDMILLGRATIDLNPEDLYRPLSENQSFKKYLGGSPANIAVGLSRLGKKCGFLGRVSDDRFGDFIVSQLVQEGVDTSRIKRCQNGEKTGLTFTEVLSPTESSILMYRLKCADLALSPDDIEEPYLARAKTVLISGTALAASPSREAALKAALLAEKTGTPVIFDIDYRPYNWPDHDGVSVYHSLVASRSDVILGSREEYDLTERLIAPGLDDEGSAKLWLGRQAKVVVIKHGARGSSAFTSDDCRYSVKPFPAEFLKGFGGGDGYASAFLSALLDDLPVIDCLERGSASASILIASHGCAPFMPTERELTDFIISAKRLHGEMIARD